MAIIEKETLHQNSSLFDGLYIRFALLWFDINASGYIHEHACRHPKNKTTAKFLSSHDNNHINDGIFSNYLLKKSLWFPIMWYCDKIDTVRVFCFLHVIHI